MKKVIIFFAAAMLAFAAKASAYDWKTATTGKIYNAGSTTLLASGTGYLFANEGATR